MLTFLTNRLCDVLDQVGRNREVARLRKENADLRYQMSKLETAKLHEARIRIERLETALTEAHGTINDLRGDPIAEAIALDTKQNQEALP